MEDRQTLTNVADRFLWCHHVTATSSVRVLRYESLGTIARVGIPYLDFDGPHAMSPNPDHRPSVQFSVAALLAVFAGIAAALGICMTLAELENAGSTHAGWTSEIRTIDGTPNAVQVPARVSTDTGRVISRWYLNSLFAALVIEIVTLIAVVTYLVKRSKRRRRDALKSLGKHGP